MSDGIHATVVGDGRLAARFAQMGGRVRARLQVVMLRLMIGLQRHVKSDKLSGQVLRNRSGHLRGSVAQSVTQDHDGVYGRVGVFSGPTVHYGRVHEFGWAGPQTVRQHVRTVTQAFGKPIAPRAITVGAHTRQVTFPERSFLRSALRDQQGDIVTSLRTAVGEVVHAA